MHPPLDEWDPAYLQGIAAPGEYANLEKKRSDAFDPAARKAATREELAKQVCAFANSGDGFLVYGIADTGGLDAGVPAAIGAQPVKAWVEADIPKLLQPPVHECQARLIQVQGHHAPDGGALVVFIPLSPRRPHWTTQGNREVPYIRAGEHSLPMKLQTMLDISTRTEAGQAVLESLGLAEVPQLVPAKGWDLILNPVVRLEAGPVCPLWGVELNITKGAGEFRSLPAGAIAPQAHVVHLTGATPLFPRRSTPVAVSNVLLSIWAGFGADRITIKAIASAGSAPPAERVFTLADVVQGRA
jgi:hypothetical protein